MTEQQFETLVQRLTERAQRQPLRYRLELLGLAAIGYVYVLVLVVIALAFSIGIAVICLLQPILLVKLLKVVWLPVWFAWSVLSALWIRFDPPQGRELKPAEAPELFAEIARIRAAIPGPAPHHVLITEDFNAAVTEHARLGPLGWWRNYLILGLPMMSALSPDQFRAVLAHEFGHFGAGDSRMTGRIYRMRILWGRLQGQFEQRGGFFFRRFFAWFGPKFNAYSFVMARAQEYAADAASARLVGARPAAEALMLARLGSAYQQQQVWQPLWKRVRDEAQPSVLPNVQLLQAPPRYTEWGEAGSQLDRALKVRTAWSDTHPALVDRLAAIGQAPVLPTESGPSAATVFLGASAERIAREFDERWKADIAEPWRDLHQRRQQEQQELADLDRAAAEQPLECEASYRRASLTELLHDDPADALPQVQQHLERFPDDAGAMFMLGRRLLARDDDAGLDWLTRAMQADAEAIKPGAELAWDYLMKHGREAETEPFVQAWREREALEQQAMAERAQFVATDDYLGHALDEAALDTLRTASRRLRWLGTVWLVRKKVTVFPDRPAWLLLAKPNWLSLIRQATALAELRSTLALDPAITVAVYSSDLKALFKKVRKVDGSLVYRA